MDIIIRTQLLWKMALNLTITNLSNQLTHDYSTIRKISIKIIKMIFISQMKNCFLRYSKRLNKKNFKGTTGIRCKSNKLKKFLQVGTNDKLIKMEVKLKQCLLFSKVYHLIKENKIKVHINKFSRIAEYKIHLLRSKWMKLKLAKKACQEICSQLRWVNQTVKLLIPIAVKTWTTDTNKKILQTNI